MSTTTADGTETSNPPPPTILDLWSQIVADENQPQGNQIDVVFRRRKPRNESNNSNSIHPDEVPRRPSRVSFADPNKRISWKRSLSTRGRVSIAVGASMVYQPELKKDKRKGKPPAIPKGKNVKSPDFDKERLYFQEVDAFELMEESPSPKKVGTWIVGNNTEEVQLPSLCSRLERWLHSRRLNPRCRPSSTLSKILDTPTMNLEVRLRSLDQSGLSNSQLSNFKSGESKRSLNNVSLIESEGCEDIEAGVKKLSLTSTTSSIYDDQNNPFSVLLEICGQSAPSMLHDLFSRYRYVSRFLVTSRAIVFTSYATH